MLGLSRIKAVVSIAAKVQTCNTVFRWMLKINHYHIAPCKCGGIFEGSYDLCMHGITLETHAIVWNCTFGYIVPSFCLTRRSLWRLVITVSIFRYILCLMCCKMGMKCWRFGQYFFWSNKTKYIWHNCWRFWNFTCTYKRFSA